ncbi:MAG: tetratricopeptide repeat protein [Rhodocyclaceae bacterium]
MKFRLSTLARSIGIALTLFTAPSLMASETAETGAPEAARIVLPAQDLTPETLYLMLLAEIAGARGEIDVAVEAYAQIARSTRDPRIARRATEVALFARNSVAAAEAARIWSAADPSSEDARRILAGVLASGGERLNEVQIELARILANNPEQLEQNLLGLNRALGRLQDKQTVKTIVDRLTEPYLDQPSAQFARAQAAAAAEDGIEALDALERAIGLRPGWEPALLFKAQILVQLDAVEEALRFLAGHVATQPDNRNLRLAYARTLVSAQRMEAAQREFQTLLDATPGDRDLLFALALVTFQVGELDQARSLFEQTLLAGHPETDGIRMNLAGIAERADDPDTALRWYGEVPPGRHYLDAQIRSAMVLARTGRLTAARELLHKAQSSAADEDDAKRLLLTETMLLRDARLFGDALNLLDAALRATPEDADYLYESAMIAERLDRVDLMETRLRRLIAIHPDHAHAYNALGYSLADRGLRLDEAESLIVKALELAPDDPFILDSLGWVRFRRSDLEGALAHLERAHELRPDPEIAAHLGEVLWLMERRDEAQRVWTDALDAHPGHEALTSTVERLTGAQ